MSLRKYKLCFAPAICYYKKIGVDYGMASYIHIKRDGEYKPHVAVPNDVFDRLREVKTNIDNGKCDAVNLKTTGFDVVEAFALYFIFLINMIYTRAAEIRMSRLTGRYFGGARTETYVSINRYLFILKAAGLIDYDGSYYTGKHVICVDVMPVEKPFTLIACVNENLIKLYDRERANTSFALHCLLNIKKINTDLWEPVEISQGKLADCLMLSKCKDAIMASADLLLNSGYISATTPQTYTTDDNKIRNYPLKYTVHDFDEPIDNAKNIEGRKNQSADRQSKKISKTEIKELLGSFEQTPILLIGGEYVKLIDYLRDTDKEIQNKLYNIHVVETVADVSFFMERYYKTGSTDNMFFIITLPDNNCPTFRLQTKLLKFIEDSTELPILVLASHDDITAPFLSRMKHCLKKSAVNVRELRFAPIHKGYESYAKRPQYYSVNNILDHALQNCPELLPPTATNLNGDPALQRLDSLISRLTGGKTYIDVLNAVPDPAANVSTETKYLSLPLRRADLARLGMDEYETAIRKKFTGE